MERKTILVVDHTLANLSYMKNIMGTYCELYAAGSGKEALKFLESTTPDLILLSEDMPEMDGVETMKNILAMPRCKDIAIVVLLERRDPIIETKALELGAADCICKPFEPLLIERRLMRILKLAEERKRLEQMATKDGLTDLWNRNYMVKAIEECAMDSKKGVFVLFDLDNFKTVNDTFGHAMGDRILIEVAENFLSFTRDDEIACRIGGDEFALFLPGQIDNNYLEMRLEAFISDINKRIQIGTTTEKNISVSAGVTLMPQDGIDFEELYHKADKALYYVKQNGKNGIRFFDEKKNGLMGDMSESNINIELLLEICSAGKNNKGAFNVEYDGFRRIAEFVARSLDRSDKEVQMVLFTLHPEGKMAEDIAFRNKYMDTLQECAQESLRRGDVITKFNGVQFLLILMDTSAENTNRIVQRIFHRMIEKTGNMPVNISFDVRSIIKEDNA